MGNISSFADIKVFSKENDPEKDLEKRTGCSFTDFIALREMAHFFRPTILKKDDDDSELRRFERTGQMAYIGVDVGPMNRQFLGNRINQFKMRTMKY